MVLAGTPTGCVDHERHLRGVMVLNEAFAEK
jgi:hypothetical protein